MPDNPVLLPRLHVAILMRIYLLGGKSVSLERIIEEAKPRYSRSEILAAIADMKGGLVRLTASGSPEISLVDEGYFHARAPLDVISLTRPNFFSPNTRLTDMLEYYDQCDKGVSVSPPKWSLLKLKSKWLFRRNCKPA